MTPPAAPDPAPGHGARPDRDHRPGLRTLLVPRLISRGLTPAQAARATGVPMPLVTLIAGPEPGTPAPSLTPTAARGTRPAAMPGPMRGRKNATRAGPLFIAAITAGCAGSILRHEPLLVTAGCLAGDSLGSTSRPDAGTRHGPEPVWSSFISGGFRESPAHYLARPPFRGAHNGTPTGVRARGVCARPDCLGGFHGPYDRERVRY
ncbi:hypothetical protein [Arthrobacter sp. 92]|uniref:hypothetical protein n=1 Tax=Arthrobacter sp. 92 TaxID=3418175 RepID=UPI003D05DBA6